MLDKERNLVVRIASIVVALLLLVPLLAWGHPLAIGGLAVVLGIWGLVEYARLGFGEDWSRYIPGLLLGGGAVGLAVHHGDPIWTSTALALAVVVSPLWVLWVRRDRADGHFGDWARFVLAVVYVPIPMALFPRLLSDPSGLGTAWLVLVMVATWAGDAGGYIAGRLLGKTRLAPYVSPNKTWEGAIGGAVLAVTFAIGVQSLFLADLIALWECAVGVVAFHVVGVSGDLAESMMKRDSGVKDSGTFMPGHGGLLDRIDSILFSIPIAWLIVQLQG